MGLIEVFPGHTYLLIDQSIHLCRMLSEMCPCLIPKLPNYTSINILLSKSTLSHLNTSVNAECYLCSKTGMSATQ